NITAEVTNFFCSDNGTPGNPADDSLHAFVAVEGGPGSGWNSNHPNGSGAYNTVVELTFAVADGVASLNVFDQDDPGCDTTLVINPADFCGLPCNLEEVVQEIVCNDNGTPADTTDDSFTLEILVTGGPGSGWVEDSSGLSGDYGVPFTFGPYPADHGHVGLIFVDADDPSCFDIFDLYTPVPCIIDCQQNPILLNFDVVFPTCFGAADGEAIAIVEGGAGGYTYQWSNGATTSANINLPDGEYFVTVTDIFGCQATGGATIAEPPLLTLDLQATPVSCPGANDGWIELFITGGTQPYTYFWTGPNGFFSTELSVINIPEGLYTVTVTDANGCSITETIEVLVGNLIDLTLEIIQQPACPTSNDGILMADATGGEGPYEYLWATGFVGPTHTGLGPGIYSVTVVDANGCTGTGEVELEALLMADAGPMQVLDCNTPTVILDGGLSTNGPNIAYEWTGPGGFLSSELAVDISESGVYILQVTDMDQLGCVATDTVFVLEDLAAPVISLAPNYISCDSATLYFPPSPGLVASWTLPGGGVSTEPLLEITESGIYVLMVTNLGNGCSSVTSISVDLDPSLCATLKGRLVRDSLPDCSPGLNEPGLSNWLIVIQGGGRVYYAVTQGGGYYEQRLPVGDYLVYPLVPNLLWIPCQNNYLVSLQVPGEMTVLDIPVLEAQPCPELSVDFSLPLLRRCWTRSLFINYCNDGTAPAEDATVVVTLDDFFTFQSATAPLLSQDGNQYTFGIGDVAAGQCGSFIVQVEVSCDAIVGQSLCAEAKIFPNAPCFPPSPNWSGASLRVSGACEGGEVQFRVENVGAGDMPAPRPCIVIEDGVMLLTMPDNIQLNSGESFTYSLPANGSTYRIEVEQEPFHPGFSMPVAVLEGCGENGQGTFSTGFVNQLALDDIDPFIDIECREVVGSYDPNDKHGFPRGYGAEHFIYPGTDIEYLVQFQNTGNDTAFLVVIRDTLSEFLDITSVHPGAASHPYTWDIDSNNILVFTFEDILLPDSTTNLAGSQGFVEFKIAQQDNLPLGTVIENSAAIYFDVNEPIITNTTFHTLGYGFIELISFTPETIVPELKISVAPNPMGEWALLELEGWTGGEGRFELLDLQGRRMREQRFSGAAFRFERQGLPAGVYAFRIVDERGRWGSGRLLIRR
ncbi:MAG: SprB repeat-containing protein, partial [Phaeodactylibacter sp.]|nr:SprB repeat-containing protein [Phaeodactylibacter sp.]